MKNYTEFKDKIYSYFSYRLNFNTHLAEDLTQEAFLKAFKNYDSFDSEKPFAPWIYRIAHNLLVNHYRDKKQEVELSEASDKGIDPLKKVEVDYDAEKLLEEMNKLNDGARELLMLRYVSELSHKEIAEILNKEEGAVRTGVSRALKSLKKIVGQ